MWPSTGKPTLAIFRWSEKFNERLTNGERTVRNFQRTTRTFHRFGLKIANDQRPKFTRFSERLFANVRTNDLAFVRNYYALRHQIVINYKNNFTAIICMRANLHVVITREQDRLLIYIHAVGYNYISNIWCIVIGLSTFQKYFQNNIHNGNI